eukprot:TRINITY_DN113585_c0_g1_i1.p1 TRINITY_DN113585_c0_g1~~TRINITY_DN113585_c0_g1_i1.p1  ORF type:complete len:127 (-),score=2.27 TRINITY_DN113585_c0_g1_i1:66-413(-)
MSNEVRASHILIKHANSRNPVSRRTNKSTAGVTKEAAIAELQAIEAKIRAGELKFGDVAQQKSDCSSYQAAGDLGSFGRGAMQKPFEDATYALQVGEMSSIVDTDSGVHLILRTA